MNHSLGRTSRKLVVPRYYGRMLEPRHVDRTVARLPVPNVSVGRLALLVRIW
jgi:hypothetical protein